MRFLLSPFTWILVAAFGFLLAPGLRRHRMTTLIAALFALAALFGAMPLGANLLVGPLERSATTGAECAAAVPPVIVVLAGGSDRAATDAEDYTALSLASLRRTIAAVALWRAAPGRSLVIAGGPAFYGAPADSALMRRFAEALGVPTQAIRIETASANTWENAHNIAKLLPPTQIALVTSALHMRRARFALARAGFAVCPFPTDRRFVAFGLPGYLLPQLGAAVKTEQALHEWIGLAYYRWLARRAAEGAPAAVRP